MMEKTNLERSDVDFPFAGNGVLLCFYSQEWYARQHCPLKNVSLQSDWRRKVTYLSSDYESCGQDKGEGSSGDE